MHPKYCVKVFVDVFYLLLIVLSCVLKDVTEIEQEQAQAAKEESILKWVCQFQTLATKGENCDLFFVRQFPKETWFQRKCRQI